MRKPILGVIVTVLALLVVNIVYLRYGHVNASAVELQIVNLPPGEDYISFSEAAHHNDNNIEGHVVTRNRVNPSIITKWKLNGKSFTKYVVFKEK